MKITLQYSGRRAKAEASHAMNATRYLGALQSIAEIMRAKRKYAELTGSQLELFQELDDDIIAAMAGIDLYDELADE